MVSTWSTAASTQKALSSRADRAKEESVNPESERRTLLTYINTLFSVDDVC